MIESILTTIAMKILELVASTIIERPRFAKIKEKLTREAPEVIALRIALHNANRKFEKKHYELSVSFFNEDFVSSPTVITELAKLLTPDQHPNSDAIAELFMRQFLHAVKKDVAGPIAYFISELTTEIKARPELHDFVTGRALDRLYDIADRVAESAEYQAKTNELLAELLAIQKATPQILPPTGDFRATIIAKVADFNLSRKVQHFRGRQALREEVGTWVDNQEYGVLQGFSGIGKTALAAAAVVDHLSANPQNKVVWLKAGNDNGQALLVAIGSADGFNAQQAIASVEDEQRIQLVRHLLHQHSVSLVVLDDVWNGQALSVVQNAIPSHTALLLTSRYRYALQKMKSVGRLEDDEALSVLNTYSDRDFSMNDVAPLLKIVGNHPYALELAGKTLLVEPHLTPEALLKRIKDKPHELHSDTEADQSRASVAAMIETSLDALDDAAKAAFLAIGAFFAPRITPELLMMYFMGTPDVSDEMAFFRDILPEDADISDDELRELLEPAFWINLDPEPAQNALHTLYKRGLAEIDPATDIQIAAYSIHDLAFSYAQSYNDDDNRQRALTACLNYTEKYNQPSLANFAALRPELENFLGAAAWAMAQGKYEAAEELTILLYSHSKILDYQGHYKQAIQLLTMAAQSAELRGDRHDQGSYLGNLGRTYGQLGQYEQAINHFQQVLMTQREIGDQRGECVTLCNLATVSSELGQNEHAIDLYQQALFISSQIDDLQSQADILGNLGNVYATLRHFDKAIEHLQQALMIKSAIGDYRGEYMTLGNLGTVYLSLRLYPLAIAYHQPALAISREIGDRRGEAQLLGNLGIAYKNLGDHEKALAHYQQARAIFVEIAVPHLIEQTDRNIANLNIPDTSPPDADLGQYQQALAISREIGDRRGEGNRLGNLGNGYADLGQYPTAIDFYQQALQISREIGDRRGEGETLGNLGNMYAELGDNDKALDYYQQARAIFVEIGVPHLIEWAGNAIAELNTPNPPPPDAD